MSLRLATHRQLVAMAKATFRPQFSDADWSAALKSLAVRQGWAWASPEAITAAMSACERAHRLKRPAFSLQREGVRLAVVPGLSRMDAATLLARVTRMAERRRPL